MRAIALAAIASIALSSAAQAATFGVTPQVGAAGVGATVQWGYSKYLGVSAGYTGLDYSIDDIQTDEVIYDADISLKNPQLMVNWAPFGGYFRVSFGAMMQSSSVDLVARGFNDPNVQSATVDVDFAQSVAPAITLGWETPMDKVGFGYHLSVGAMYAGQPEVAVDIKCNIVVNCVGKDKAEEQEIEDELSKYKVLPILQAGVLYRL